MSPTHNKQHISSLSEFTQEIVKPHNLLEPLSLFSETIGFLADLQGSNA